MTDIADRTRVPTASFVLNGTPVSVRARPPPPARRAARGARRHLAEGRLLAVGPVRLLHGARSTARPMVSLPAVAGQGRRQVDRHARGRRRTTSGTRFADAFAACGGLQCGFCIPGIVMRAKAQIDKKGADLTRDDMAPPPRRPPVPLHRLREDPRRHRGGGQGQARSSRALGGTVGGVGRQVRGGASWRSATAATSTTSACPACCTPRCTSPTTPAPTSLAHRHHGGARRGTGVVAVFTAADIPGELRVGHHPQGLAGDDPGRRAARRTPATCWRSSWPRPAQQARAAAALVEVGYDVLDAGHRPGRRHRRRRADRRVGHRRQRAVASARTRAATSTPRWRRARTRVHEAFQTQRIEHAFLEPESTLAVPTRRRRRAHAARLLRRPGRVGRPQRHRQRARRRQRPGHRRAGLQRRRLRRQGGHEQPGPGRARGVAARTGR